MANQRHQEYQCNFGCSVEATSEVIRGKWKGVILYHLVGGIKRFKEICRLIPNVTQQKGIAITLLYATSLVQLFQIKQQIK